MPKQERRPITRKQLEQVSHRPVSKSAAKKVGLTVLETYATLAASVNSDLEAQKPPVSCTKGCSQCCHPIIFVTFTEALAIVQDILGDHTKKRMVPGLRERLETSIGELSTLNNDLAETHQNGSGFEVVPAPLAVFAEYFHRQVPCVFLKDNLCTVYDTRPTSCRFKFVKSDPIYCRPSKEGETGEILGADLRGYETKVMDVAHRAMHSLWASKWIAPLQISVWWALHFFDVGDEQFMLDLRDPKFNDRNIGRWSAWTIRFNETPTIPQEEPDPLPNMPGRRIPLPPEVAFAIAKDPARSGDILREYQERLQEALKGSAAKEPQEGA